MTGLRVQRTKAIAAGEIEPPESREFDPAEAEWSQTEMLLAMVIDEIRSLQYMYITSHSEKGSKVALPVRVPRPGIKQAPKSKLTLEQRMLLDPRLRQRAARDLAEERIGRARIAAAEKRREGDDG